MLRCPKCRGSMEQREAKGHYGAKLRIFQCPECLGFWVDGEVVIALSHESALSAEVDVDFEDISTEPREIGAFCPRCETYLMEQTGGGLPKGLRIDYCEQCQGFWFDKGEMMIYKSHIENKRKAFAGREEEKRRRKARLSASAPASNASLVLNLLNTKIHRIGF